MKTILGKKIGMTQIFVDHGVAVPVTVIEAGPAVVTQIKTVETDGYNAVQIGFEDQKEHRVNKPMMGHFAKAQVAPKKYLTEIRLSEGETYEAGQVITVADFEEGVKLDITGTSKGKGTQGNIKRHGHRRGPMSHGSKYHRGVGSLSANSDPSRVFKNKKMAGQYGGERVTIQNLEIVKVDAERNLIMIKGAIPGANGSLVIVRDAVKA